MAKESPSFSSKFNSVMNKQIIFTETVCMETQTVYRENGQVETYPCDFERGQHIVHGATCVSQKGRMKTNDDGTSSFRPYRKNTGSRYRKLWEQPYGCLKMSKTKLVLNVCVPLDKADAIQQLEDDAEMLKPMHTSKKVLREIENAIRELKRENRR